MPAPIAFLLLEASKASSAVYALPALPALLVMDSACYGLSLSWVPLAIVTLGPWSGSGSYATETALPAVPVRPTETPLPAVLVWYSMPPALPALLII